MYSTDHHVVNAAAIGTPLLSFMSQMPGVVTMITGILGAIWYILLISKEIAARRRAARERGGDNGRS